MNDRIILASGSETRQALLRNAGVKFEISIANIDEDTIRKSLESESASPRDIADALAEFKARKVAMKQPDALVIGCDQTLDFEGKVLSRMHKTSCVLCGVNNTPCIQLLLSLKMANRFGVTLGKPGWKCIIFRIAI